MKINYKWPYDKYIIKDKFMLLYYPTPPPIKNTKQTKLKWKFLCFNQLDLEGVFPLILEKN